MDPGFNADIKEPMNDPKSEKNLLLIKYCIMIIFGSEISFPLLFLYVAKNISTRSIKKAKSTKYEMPFHTPFLSSSF